MSESTLKDLYPVTDSVRENALLNKEQYEEMYKRSIADPEIGNWFPM